MDLINVFKKLNKRNKILKQKFKKAKKSQISKQNTLFIFDWDDTLFPTSWMDKKENKNANLCLLDDKICTLIKKIEPHGKIAIVSNATLSWIKHTAKYMPKTKKLLKKQKIMLFSTQDKYKKKYEISEWKKYAFRYIIKKHMRSFVMNIFSIGDSKHEYHGLMSLPYVNHINNGKRIMYLKSIKLSENPKHDKMIKQIDYLKKNILKYTDEQKNLDIFY